MNTVAAGDFPAMAWDNRSAPGGCGNTGRGLTRSSGTSREGLAMKATRRTCSLCTNPHEARGLCRSHYDKALYAGTIQPLQRPTLAERLVAKSERATDGTGCLLWTGQVNWNGYGLIGVGPLQRPVHRVAYEVAVGPIPQGMEIDHVHARGCRHRHCIEPSHLEAVTPLENQRRKQPGRDWSKCPNGHEMTPENTGTRGAGRVRCKACRRKQIGDVA